MGIKVNIISLGCAKNLVDSEQMAASLQEAGIELTDLSEAQIAVVNTCGFIESAQKEGIDTILSLAEMKQRGELKGIVAAGCLTERFKNEFHKELPEVDAVLGTGEYSSIVDAVKAVWEGVYCERFSPAESAALCGKRILMTPSYSAYLKIAEGCSNYCSYCVIPYIRGRYRSRTLEDLTEEARELASAGVKELIVIAQDVSRYGEDLYGRYMLPELLKRLCAIDGIEWIRLHYLYPEAVGDELLETVKNNDKILKYFDIPFQHINEDILRRMNRHGGALAVKSVLSKIRDMMPQAVIRTSIIVGFPGESEEKFTELYDFLAEQKLQRAGIFVFSCEDGTPASRMPDQIDPMIAEARREKLYALQSAVMEEFSAGLVGKTLDVLCCGEDELGRCYGRTYMDSPEVDGLVYFESPVEEGRIVPARIIGYEGCDLFAAAEEGASL